MKISEKFIIGAATGGWIGFLPFSPGTFGSLPGILLFYGIAGIPFAASLVLVAALIAAAVWIAGAAEKLLAAKDPGCIVIDEIAGMGVTFLGVSFSMEAAIIGFMVFRFFDILKPFPVRYLEKRLSGGLGVVMDDVAAGIMSNIVLHVILVVIK
jgi:phosphatidylglycerophosphatase A